MTHSSDFEKRRVSGSGRDDRRPSAFEESVSDHGAPANSLFVRLGRAGVTESEVLQRPSISYWQDAWIRLRTNRIAMASAVYILVLGLLAGVVPELLPYADDEQEIWNKHARPSLTGDDAIVVDSDAEVPAPLTVALPEAAGDESIADEVTTEAPPSPRGTHIIGQPLTTSVALGWEPVPGVEGYRIYRSISRDTLGVPLDDLPPEQVSYADRSSLSKDTTYFYFVTAFNPFGDSLDPELVEVTPHFALPLSAAKILDPTAEVGQVIRTRAHWLGTDYLGRDMMARVMTGARISLTIGLAVPLICMLIGVIYGSLSGFIGGLVDDAMMRITDLVSTVPDLLVVILLQVVMGSGMSTLIVAMCATYWARMASQIRGEVLRLREMEFVAAGKVLGTSYGRIIGRHLFPNVMGTVLVLVTVAVPYAIFSEAFLSFIGLGIRPPTASWGTVTKEGARVFITYPHELLIPSALICVTMLAFNLLGDGLRDALDPKMRGVR